ncbi:hypothetical protein CEXT_239431 [Caerostris extrusa]|uniref:Uncharacterized protein n=1 Tax=Caerostris extrusa TaxID=172846 RepID=A0AAV4XB81_CAEEX|nr:hypothetical protein CEXT_239431 [Caerostris extrusa]
MCYSEGLDKHHSSKPQWLSFSRSYGRRLLFGLLIPYSFGLVGFLAELEKKKTNPSSSQFLDLPLAPNMSRIVIEQLNIQALAIFIYFLV